MGNVLSFAKDQLVSLVNNLGKMGSDKAASTVYTAPLWTDQQLTDSYRSSWLARKIVDIPAFDSFRRWRSWQAEADQITRIEKEEKRLGVKHKLLKAKIAARLFGGAALYIGTGEDDPLQPLNPDRIALNGIRFLNVMKRRDLAPGELIQDPESEWYGQPAYYELRTSGTAASITTGVRIHPSRLVRFIGAEIPDPELAAQVGQEGWGDSILISTLEAIKNSDGTAANIASLVFEAKLDIVKVPDLMSSLSDPNYEQRLLQRFNLANIIKGINQMVLLDKDEEWEQKSANFAQLPDVLMSFMQLVSGAADIPVTRLLGQSPAGLNSTGESDLRNYYDRIQSIQELEIQPAIGLLDECVIRSALGTRPADAHYIWSSLWQISDKERADIGKIDAETIAKLNETGLFPTEALAKSGANMLVEHSIMPGLLEEIDAAGGFPDYEAELEAEAERTRAAAQPPVDERNVADAKPKTLYVRRDVVNAADIKAFYEAQGLEVTVNNLHVTIIHSQVPIDWFSVGEAWQAEIKLAGGARDHELFGPPGLEDSLVLMIKSIELEWRHEQFKNAGAQSSYDEFQPHITLRYKDGSSVENWEALEPYKGEIVLGPEIFEEVKP